MSLLESLLEVAAIPTNVGASDCIGLLVPLDEGKRKKARVPGRYVGAIICFLKAARLEKSNKLHPRY